MYTLIKPYKVGDIEFAAGTMFKYDGQSYGLMRLAFESIPLRYHGKISVSFTDLNEYFAEE